MQSSTGMQPGTDGIFARQLGWLNVFVASYIGSQIMAYNNG